MNRQNIRKHPQINKMGCRWLDNQAPGGIGGDCRGRDSSFTRGEGTHDFVNMIIPDNNINKTRSNKYHVNIDINININTSNNNYNSSNSNWPCSSLSRWIWFIGELYSNNGCKTRNNSSCCYRCHNKTLIIDWLQLLLLLSQRIFDIWLVTFGQNQQTNHRQLVWMFKGYNIDQRFNTNDQNVQRVLALHQQGSTRPRSNDGW